MRISLSLLCCVTTVIAAAGCSTMWITTGFDPSVDFATLKTYCWLPDPEVPTLADRAAGQEIDATVQDAVNEGLSTKGYALLQSAPQPDFCISYRIALNKRLAIQGMGVPVRESDREKWHAYEPVDGKEGDSRWGVRPSQRPSPGYVREYEEGTLILDFVDGRTMHLLWRGSAQTEVNRLSSAGKRRTRIREAVRRLLERFPPV